MTPHARTNDFLTLERSVKKNLRRFLERQKTSDAEPECSVDEILAMALARDTKRRWKLSEILGWILHHFPLYQQQAAEALAKTYTYGSFTDIFEQRLGAYDFPGHQSRSSSSHARYCITPSAASTILTNVAGVSRSTSFPFLRLPPELRSMVYEYLLSYRGCSLKLETGTCGFMANVQRGHSRMWRHHVHSLALSHPSQMLALLRVNKQIFAEAMPMFYATNHFVFGDFLVMNKFFSGIGGERLKHIRTITFDYSSVGHYRERRSATAAVNQIAKWQNLRELRIGGLEEQSLAGRDTFRFGYRPNTAIAPRYVPGLSAFRKMRGLEALHLQHDAPLIDAYLRPQMMRPRTRREKASSRPRVKPQKKNIK